MIPVEIVAPEKQYTLFFDDVEVPAENLLGAEHEGLRQVFFGLNPERILGAALANGMARYGLARAAEYANERRVWGTPIGTHQGIAHPLAKAKIEAELARLITQKAAWQYDNGIDAGEAANMAMYADETAGWPRDMTDPTGLGMTFGTAEEGMGWVGRRGERRAEVPVNEAMTRTYCALIEDANPDYRDRGVAPPGMLMAWLMPLPWRPGGGHRRTGLFALDVPLPGHHIINVSTDTELSAPLRVGDHVVATEEILEVSPPKRTRLGEGHFITTVTDFRAGERPVARNTNLLYRYDTDHEVQVAAADPDLDARLAEPTRTLHSRTRATMVPAPVVGDELPAIELDVSLHRVVLNAAATWDWFPGHHNPFYARTQGQRTIYLSTLFFHGFVDRLVTDWAGPGAFLTRRRITMRRSIFAGETATARGRVTEVREEASGTRVGVEATVDGPDGPCVTTEASVRLARP